MFYDFKDLENSSKPAEREISAKILNIYRALDQVVKGESDFFATALRTEDTKEDALIDIVGFCKNEVEEVWQKYDVDKKRHITR